MDHPSLQVYQVLYERICAAWVGLPDKPEETPETTIKALWHAAAGSPVSAEHAAVVELPGLDEKKLEVLTALVEQRLSGVPLAYLTGRQTFMGITMLASPQAMIPRKETEIVGRAAIDTVRALAAERGAVKVIDLCTGSGNLALAMAAHEPQCEVWGIDITAEAAALACENARFLGLENRAHFLQGDLFAPVDTEEFHGAMDLITCNPPYISSAQVDRLPGEIQHYEPRPAFDGGPFGVQVLNRLIKEAPRFLKPSSWLCFEVGLRQGKLIASMLAREEAYAAVETFNDEAGEVRALRAQTKPASKQP